MNLYVYIRNLTQMESVNSRIQFGSVAMLVERKQWDEHYEWKLAGL